MTMPCSPAVWREVAAGHRQREECRWTIVWQKLLDKLAHIEPKGVISREALRVSVNFPNDLWEGSGRLEKHDTAVMTAVRNHWWAAPSPHTGRFRRRKCRLSRRSACLQKSNTQSLKPHRPQLPLFSPHPVFSHQCLTVKHLWSHPIGASHHSVALLPVYPPEHSLLIGLFFRWRLYFVLDYKSGQSKVSYHHSVVLLARVRMN